MSGVFVVVVSLVVSAASLEDGVSPQHLFFPL